MTVQGHPRSLIWAPIEIAYGFLLILNSRLTLVLSCPVSDILELLYVESHFFRTLPLFRPKLRNMPFGVDP